MKKMKKSGHRCRQGPSLLKKFWGDKPYCFRFRCRHHVNLTVVGPFCKIGKMGGNIMEFIYFDYHALPMAMPIVVV